MGLIQRLILKLMPASKRQAIEAESRAWILKCDICGSERSVWDMGGIRWKASGSPRERVKCVTCGKVQWHTIRYSE